MKRSSPPPPSSFVSDGADDGATDWKEECRTYFGTDAMKRCLALHPELTWEQMYTFLYNAHQRATHSPELLECAQAALHLCRSLLAVREGVTDELIQQIAEHLEAAIAKSKGGEE